VDLEVTDPKVPWVYFYKYWVRRLHQRIRF